MNIQDLLAQTGSKEIVTLQTNNTLLDMSKVLCEHNIGALLVMDESKNLAGILSERDLARAVSRFPNDVSTRSVSDIMTRSVITCSLEDDVLTTLNLMNEKGIRHVPVVDGKTPIAVISIREFDFACKRLNVLANTDELTGLPNRRHFMDALEAEFGRYERFQTPFCVAILDIDHFKKVNDTYGHEAGDQVLQCLADVFRKGLRKYDLAGRLGGEEFGIILPNSDPVGAARACEHVREAIRSQEVETDQGVIRFTASFGIAEAAHDTSDIASILARADQRLYQAKETGRDRIVAGPLNLSNGKSSIAENQERASA